MNRFHRSDEESQESQIVAGAAAGAGVCATALTPIMEQAIPNTANIPARGEDSDKNLLIIIAPKK